MLKEILQEAKSTKTGMKWVGGPDDYKNMKDIEDLILSYDFHAHRIDDGKTYAKAQNKNKSIVKALNAKGVTAFSNGGMDIGDFKKANKKDIKEIK